MKITQSHFLTDVRLVLGYAAVIICGITFAYDYKLGFENTKHWTMATVAAYFLLNGAFTYWLWFVEKDVVFQGTYKGRKVGISEVERPVYVLTVLRSQYLAGQRSWIPHTA